MRRVLFIMFFVHVLCFGFVLAQDKPENTAVVIERIYEQMKYVLKVAEPDEGQQIIGVLKRLLQCCLNLRNKVLVRRQYQLWEPEIGTKYDPESMFASGKVIQGKVESVLLPGILMVKNDDSTSVVKPCNVILNR